MAAKKIVVGGGSFAANPAKEMECHELTVIGELSPHTYPTGSTRIRKFMADN